MLVLSRKLGEQILIGEGVTLTVLEIQGQRIKIGIDAPRECLVLRGELNAWPADSNRAPRSSAVPKAPRSEAWLAAEALPEAPPGSSGLLVETGPFDNAGLQMAVAR